MHYRIMVLGKFRKWISFFLHGVIEGAIRNGWQVDRVGLDNPCGDGMIRQHVKSIRERMFRMKPHILFCHSVFGEESESYEGLLEVLADIRAELGTKVALHIGDPRPTLRFPFDLSMIADMCLVNTDIKEYLDLCENTYKVKSYFWPFACWQSNELSKENLVYHMSFLGYMSEHKRYIKRTKFVRRCQDSSILQLKVLNEKLGRTHFYNRDIALTSKGILAIPSPRYAEYSLDARPFIFGGYGGVVFAKRTAIAEKIFTHGKHVIFFDDIDEPRELEKLFLRYGDDKDIRYRAFNYMQKYHNYKNRVKDVIDIFEGRLDRPRVYIEDFYGDSGI